MREVLRASDACTSAFGRTGVEGVQVSIFTSDQIRSILTGRYIRLRVKDFYGKIPEESKCPRSRGMLAEFVGSDVVDIGCKAHRRNCAPANDLMEMVLQSVDQHGKLVLKQKRAVAATGSILVFQPCALEDDLDHDLAENRHGPAEFEYGNIENNDFAFVGYLLGCEAIASAAEQFS